MHIYLVRHAHARPGDNDDNRPLSSKGLAQIQSVGRRLRKAEAIDAKLAWHSPLVRSRDTAVHLVRRLRLRIRLHEVEGLRPGDDPETVARRLEEMRQPLLVVGHDPHLSALASLLVTGRLEPLVFQLKKCAVLRLDREDNRWSVRWLVSPELF